jgi:hypothetical protein
VARLVLAFSLALASWPAVQGAEFPLRIAPDHRTLVDAAGSPFLVAGDTAWSLIVQPSEADIDRYLQDRQQRGFNAIIVNLIEHKFCTRPPRTRAGLAPFRQAGDFGTPNPAYFDYAHRVIANSHRRGITVWLAPAYLGAGGGDEGWFRELKANGKARVRAYGQFIGKRFRDLPNIVWVLGGDFTPPPADQWTVHEVAEGIRAEDPAHLMTGHPAPERSPAVAFGEPDWLTVNAVYSYERTLFRPLHEEYARRQTRPFVLIETVYEGEHDAKPEQIRRQAYWAMLCGACGQFLGNNPIWHYDGPGLFPVKTTWEAALDSPGTRDMVRLRQVFAALPWYRLVPDKVQAIVTADSGKDVGTAVAARTADGELAVIYIPSTGTQPRELTVNLASLAGSLEARWYNPTNGRYTATDKGRLPNQGSHTFRTPGDNGTGTNDWLLVLTSPR